LNQFEYNKGIKGQHENVAERINRVLDRWEKLRNALIRSKLGEFQTLQDFSRDAYEIEAWIMEKLQVAISSFISIDHLDQFI
jgi:hypothetical protein